MFRIHILFAMATFVLVSAYRQIHFPTSEPRTSNNEDEQQPLQYPSRADRVSNERSIPFRSNAQKIQANDWSKIVLPNDGALPRNGNITFRTAGHSKNTPTRKMDNFVPEVPEECQEIGFCEGTVPNYPQDYVNNLLEKMKEKYSFNLDVDTPEITQRRGPGEESLELCEHRSTIVYPSVARNTKGQWVYVINKPDEPIQGFKGEICVNAGSSCSDIAYFTDRYNATCQQKKVERAVWTLDYNGKVVTTAVPIPSCCACIVRVVK